LDRQKEGAEEDGGAVGGPWSVDGPYYRGVLSVFWFSGFFFPDIIASSHLVIILIFSSYSPLRFSASRGDSNRTKKSTMLAKVLLAAALVNVSLADTEPWFCHGIDCPTFTNTSTDGIEVRTYSAAYWASTNVSSISFDYAVNVGFNRLFNYISGENDSNGTIDMTAPVLNRVEPGAGPNCNSTFTISFFTPFSYQESGPPSPTSSLVFIETIGPLNVAVSAFGGFDSQKVVIAEAAALEQKVSAAPSIQVDEAGYGDAWFFAGYDPPFKLTNRHNEIWVPVVAVA